MAEGPPQGFGRDDHGRLLIAGVAAEDHVQHAGDTPLFLYDRQMLDARVAEFRAAMPRQLQLHYAVKANPFRPLLRSMAGLVDGMDVASAGEARMALDAGMAPQAISFAGPAKRQHELAFALAEGILLHVESATEVQRIADLASGMGVAANVALRINPPFVLKGAGMKMGGVASAFGVDVAEAPALLRRLQRPPFRFAGFHVFAGSQNLDLGAIADSMAASLQLLGQLAKETGVPVPQVNLGGGLGVPYFPADRELDIEALGQRVGRLLAELPPALRHSRFIVELGRWLVAEAGVYLCRVIDIKQSGGRTFLVTDGGLHHQLAATGNFGTVIRRNYPLANASRDGAGQKVTVTGCLCTPLDHLANDVLLASPRIGDLIAVFMAGAYGRSASPENFLGHPPPGEYLVGRA